LSIIETSHLSKRYKSCIGVEDLNLEIREGELFGFLGPNGSGKTTTIRMLLGFLKPTAGSACVLGYDGWRESQRAKTEIGYLPGELRIYPWLTCRSAARLIGSIRRRNLSDSFNELANLFDLDPDAPARSMSRGMKQKLGLILAMAHQPRLLILDEPTTALDPLMQKILYDRLRDLASQGHTIFFSSHTLSEVEYLCDSVAILKEGRLAARERIQDLRARAARRVRILWKTAEDAGRIQPPPSLNVQSRNGLEWEAAICGETAELVRWCAAQPIADLGIGQPDLSQVFQEFYVKRID
jgi:ABC-2 type transport system ATP-binding protein